MKFIHFTLIQLALALVLGIVLAYFFPIDISITNYLAIGLCVLFLIWLLLRYTLKPFPFFEIIALLFFIGIGYANLQIRLPQFQKDHYSKLYTSNQFETLQIKIREVLKPSLYQDKYIAELLRVDSLNTKGKILLNIKKDSLNDTLQVDDIILLYSDIKEIRHPLNPNQFDYKKYMQNLGVYFQVESAASEIISHNNGIPTPKGLAERLREYLILKLGETPIEANERSIIEALILGQRRNIDATIYNDYAAAGAIHILAVSGLHVGILFFILSWIFKPFGFFKYGKLISQIFVILFLWGFAFLAGLSPSVIRAVTMFSFFAFANMINRPSNSFNVLFLSFFFLLLINPNWLFQVGFQMSYLAVFFIIWIQPKLSKLYRPRFKIAQLFWDIISVTLAAQLGIAPISIYYFHQFPGLFFLSNLVILPFLALFLGYGILVVLLAGINLLPDFLAIGYNYIIKSLNNFILWVAEQEAFLFKDISLSFLKMIGFYLLITTIVLLWQQHNKKWGFAVLGSLIFIFGISINEKMIVREELVIFHKSRKSIIAVTSKESFKVFQTDTNSIKNDYPIKHFRIAKNKKYSFYRSIPSVFKLKNKTFLLIDSLGIYPSLKGTTILLFESPKVNLERLIDSIHPELIIADGNNYTSYIKRWKKTCKLKNIPFYSTREKGAFVFN